MVIGKDYISNVWANDIKVSLVEMYEFILLRILGSLKSEVCNFFFLSNFTFLFISDSLKLLCLTAMFIKPAKSVL